MEWLVSKRSENQEISMKLYKLSEEYSDVFDAEDSDQGVFHFLISVTFSMWRAVFLGEVDNRKLLADAKGFLKNLILHNSVTYQNDHQTKAYSFGYYITNAHLGLVLIFESRPDILPVKPNASGMDAKDEWEYYHGLLAQAFRRFEDHLKKRQISN